MRSMDQTLTTTHFEACVGYQSFSHDAECEACGWLEEEHVEGVLAQVIHVTPRAALPLRRAS